MKRYILIVFSITFSFFAFQEAKAACENIPVGGSYVISSSCAFSGTVDGVDGGGITVNPGATLTVTPGQTIVWSPGFEIKTQGNGAIIISKGSGAQLKKGYIWLTDADNDGYPTTAIPIAQFASTTSAQYRRSAAKFTNHFAYVASTTYDYNDASSTVYTGTACNGKCTINKPDGTCGYQSSSQDLFNDCAASYNACSGNNRIGPDGNCSGTGASCKTTGLSSACATASGVCQSGGGCTAGICNTVIRAPDNSQTVGCNSLCQACQSGVCGVADAGTNPGGKCGTTGCYTGSCKGTTAVCGWNTTGDGNCPACKTCVGATSGTCVNYTANTQDTGCNGTCQACQSGTCGLATAGTDPGDDCAASAVSVVLAQDLVANYCAAICSARVKNTGNCDSSGACSTSSETCIGGGTDAAGTDGSMYYGRLGGWGGDPPPSCGSPLFAMTDARNTNATTSDPCYFYPILNLDMVCIYQVPWLRCRCN